MYAFKYNFNHYRTQTSGLFEKLQIACAAFIVRKVYTKDKSISQLIVLSYFMPIDVLGPRLLSILALYKAEHII